MDKAQSKFDIPTICAIAIIAYILSVFCHEILGHGGACLATGNKISELGAYYIDCVTPNNSLAMRIVAVAGSLANVVLMFIFYVFFKAETKKPNPNPHLILFYWLAGSINAFTWAGYLMFSGISGIGDFGTGSSGFLSGFDNQIIYRIAMAVIGTLIYIYIGRRSGNFLGEIFGESNRKLGRKYAYISYFSGAFIGIIVGLLNPVGIIITLASAVASTMGGTSGLLWLPNFMKGGTNPPEITRNYPFIVAAIITLAAFAVILGPSIKL